MEWDLFFSGLTSATLLPGASEALLIYRLEQGQADVVRLVLSVTLGNVIGSLITYFMGRGGNFFLHRKWLGISESALQKAELRFQKWGVYSLLLAWVPVIGDPLCLLAGLLKINPFIFTLLVSAGKLLRYVFLAALFI